MTDIASRIGELKLVPVVAIDSADSAQPLADALQAGGLPCAEITLRTEAGAAAIRQLADRKDFLIGAGTVHSVDDAKRVVDAGARFVVTPGINPRTIEWCLGQRIPIFPGIATPTDLETALTFGLKLVKFFPAEPLGGVSMLKALCGPYSNVTFMPTGGINPDNVTRYLEMPQVIACGGSWMAGPAMIAAGRFDEITERTRAAMALVA